MHKISCVRCKKKFSKAMKFCPFCNMPHVVPPTKAKAMCPKCKKELKPEKYRKVELDLCPSCSGMWLDTLEFEHLTSEKDVYADPSSKTHYLPPPLEETAGYYECVRCNSRMHRIRFRTISGVMIDICAYHGVWLDKGELSLIRDFIASGGLDRSQDKAIRKHSREITKLASEVNDVRLIQRVLHRWNLKRILLDREF